MAYLVLARKYRPRQFAELVGQSHVTNTLLNAFKQNKVGQAYLFTGTRGVGKTSAARIFAQALRCEKPSTPGIPCNACPSCDELNNGSSTDVLEIDGASNNGVDNVREIRESVKFLPSHGKVKVYIIDEVHMLTGAAFNALLKTLEEPPPHIVFILATTDVQKIPPTILSRCQRFDFRRVPQPVIFDFLQQILQKEKIKAEPGALRLVARKAEGSLRDSLSLMDQVIALSGEQITQAKAVEILGVVDGMFLAKLLSEVFQNKVLEAMRSIEHAFNAGIEMKQLALDLAESLRNALLVKLESNSSLVELTDDERKALEEAVKPVSVESIQAGFRLVSQSLEEIARSPMPRASLEMIVARLSGIGRLASIDELLARLSDGKGAYSAPSAAIPSNARPSPSNTNAPAATQAAAPRPSPTTSHELSWAAFVSFVTRERPSFGTILEYAVPVSPVESWKSDAMIVLGFGSQQLFYLEQLRQKANFQALEALLGQFLGKKINLRLDEVKAASTQTNQAAPKNPTASMAETQASETLKNTENLKNQFLQQDIVKSAQEIFGAKLSSFDIVKPTNNNSK